MQIPRGGGEGGVRRYISVGEMQKEPNFYTQKKST